MDSILIFPLNSNVSYRDQGDTRTLEVVVTPGKEQLESWNCSGNLSIISKPVAYLLSRFFGQLHHVLMGCGFSRPPDPARSNEMSLTEAIAFEEVVEFRKYIVKHALIGVSLHLNENQFLPRWKARPIRVGHEIRHEIGKSPVQKSLQLARYVPEVDRSCQHENVRFTNRLQDLGQIVFQYASIEFGLARHASLATAKIQII